MTIIPTPVTAQRRDATGTTIDRSRFSTSAVEPCSPVNVAWTAIPKRRTDIPAVCPAYRPPMTTPKMEASPTSRATAPKPTSIHWLETALSSRACVRCSNSPLGAAIGRRSDDRGDRFGGRTRRARRLPRRGIGGARRVPPGRRAGHDEFRGVREAGSLTGLHGCPSAVSPGRITRSSPRLCPRLPPPPRPSPSGSRPSTHPDTGLEPRTIRRSRPPPPAGR